jgi:hypothetical protein
MDLTPQGWGANRQPSKLRPMIKPGAPRWVDVVARLTQQSSPSAIDAGFVLGVASIVIVWALALSIIDASLTFWFLGIVGVVGALATVKAARLTARPRDDGEAGELLTDIDQRFAYAERKIGEVPTGIVWRDVERDVRVVLWECATHASAVAELDAELVDLRWAEPGTPQGALRHAVEDRRTEHLDVMRTFQRDADQLARLAGNAAAAAKVALRSTGSLKALEVVTPSIEALAARSALDDAKARLAMLADVWASLDDSGEIAGEQLRLEQRRGD